MTECPFKIFPSKGYLNSQFQVVLFDRDYRTLSIEKDGKIVKSVDFKNGELVTLTNFEEPGIYIAKSTYKARVFTQEIEIKNSIRLGTSELKSSFVFEDIPYAFFLMKDRIIIYDEINNYLLTENNLSPTEIKKIDKHNLLFITKHSNSTKSIVNFAIFSLIEFRIIWELKNSFEEILINLDGTVLWVYNFIDKEIICYSLNLSIDHTPSAIFNLKSVESFTKLKNLDCLFIEEKESVILLNLKKVEKYVFKKTDNILIDKQANFYQIDEKSILCKNLLNNKISEIRIKKIDGLNICESNVLFVGEKFIVKMEDEYEGQIKGLVEKYLPQQDDSKIFFRKYIGEIENLKSNNVFHSLFLTVSGVVLLEKIDVSEITSISYRRDNVGNSWIGNPDYAISSNYSIVHIEPSKSQELKVNLISCSQIYVDAITVIFETVGHAILVYYDNKIQVFPDVRNVIINTGNFTYDYLLVGSGKKQLSLYSFDDLEKPILENIEVLNLGYLRKHGILWFVGKSKKMEIENLHFIEAYDLKKNIQIEIDEHDLKHSAYVDASKFEISEFYLQSSSGTLIDPHNCNVKDAVVGIIETTSEDLNKVITIRDDLIYFLKFNKGLKKYTDIEINIPRDVYKESYLSPNGKFLVLKKDVENYILYDIETGEDINFFSGKFLAFSKEGNIIFERDISRNVVIIDPLTFKEITPPNYHYYRFLSPDGKLYCQVSSNVRHFDRIENRQITFSEVLAIANSIGSILPKDNEVEKNRLLQNRKMYFNTHKVVLKKLGIDKFEEVSANIITNTEKYIQMGIVGTKTVVDIIFPSDIVYYNYAAFSFDNKYLAYVGKPSSQGLIVILRLKFDERRKELKIEDEYITRYPQKASWVCGFSKTGYFATYDSIPNTYIIKADNNLFKENNGVKVLKDHYVTDSRSINKTYKNWTEISGKNFLCFSPSGNFIALSEQGYEPLTLGGYGHQESRALHIASVPQGYIFHSFLEHGDQIKDDKSNKIIFVAFSDDESKIMSMSKDGVVIVRNINFENYIATQYITENALVH